MGKLRGASGRILGTVLSGILVAASCTSDPSPLPSAVSAGRGLGRTVVLKTCAPVPLNRRNPASSLFAEGGRVEAILKRRLQLARDGIGLAPTLAGEFRDPLTTLPHVRALEGRLLDVPTWAAAAAADVARPVRGDCARSAGQVLAGVLGELVARDDTAATGTQPRRQPVPDLGAGLPAEQPLVAAFRSVFAGHTPWPHRPASGSLAEARQQIDALAAALDDSTERALAAVVAGMARAEAWRLAAVRDWYPNGVDYDELAKFVTSRQEPPVNRIRSFDYVLMGRAGAGLALAAERLKQHLVVHPLPPSLDIHLATPLGEIVLNGAARDDTYSLAAPALVVDHAGNDTYNGVVAGPSLESVPLSVSIDLAGDDRYLGGDTLGNQGAGLLSFGFLFDHAGDDTYRAKATAQGAGILGVGALLDEAGRDTHEAEHYAQGAGYLGFGAAVDLTGDDSWRLLTHGQGYGYVRSAGLLLDAEGNDAYDADDTKVISPSPQSAEHNTSLAQGAGEGLRGNGLGATMSGGTGLLVDLAGDDTYGCGVFCQGSGFFFGQGILADAGGNDSYKGVWYVQGAGAHFALGVLADDAGADHYSASLNASQGAGHDGAAGFLVDGAGDDTSTVTNLSHGAGSDNGFGFFVDAEGNDAYDAAGAPSGVAFGQVTTDAAGAGDALSRGVDALGLFLDLGGADDYRGAPPEVKSGASWRRAAGGSAAARVSRSQRGYGEDAPQ
ncbi:MAG TPA: hypothetical protein VM142_00605 [Acidimicrobiales bacterium]|nr:hypothetical protein [Acidimicrobiales bacterium]